MSLSRKFSTVEEIEENNYVNEILMDKQSNSRSLIWIKSDKRPYRRNDECLNKPQLYALYSYQTCVNHYRNFHFLTQSFRYGQQSSTCVYWNILDFSLRNIPPKSTIVLVKNCKSVTAMVINQLKILIELIGENIG